MLLTNSIIVYFFIIVNKRGFHDLTVTYRKPEIFYSVYIMNKKTVLNFDISLRIVSKSVTPFVYVMNIKHAHNLELHWKVKIS